MGSAAATFSAFITNDADEKGGFCYPGDLSVGCADEATCAAVYEGYRLAAGTDRLTLVPPTRTAETAETAETPAIVITQGKLTGGPSEAAGGFKVRFVNAARSQGLLPAEYDVSLRLAQTSEGEPVLCFTSPLTGKYHSFVGTRGGDQAEYTSAGRAPLLGAKRQTNLQVPPSGDWVHTDEGWVHTPLEPDEIDPLHYLPFVLDFVCRNKASDGAGSA
ncbi:hypothetical protein Q5752_003476 [Cryptotrichosporon argae]